MLMKRMKSTVTDGKESRKSRKEQTALNLDTKLKEEGLTHTRIQIGTDRTATGW